MAQRHGDGIEIIRVRAEDGEANPGRQRAFIEQDRSSEGEQVFEYFHLKRSVAAFPQEYGSAYLKKEKYESSEPGQSPGIRTEGC